MRSLIGGIVVALVLGVVPGAAAAEDKVVVRGGGWGHGIGMSQYGAYGRAQNGADATKILTKYYSGTKVSRRDMPARVRVGLLQARSQVSLSSKALAEDGGRLIWKVAGRPGKLASGGLNADWRIEPSSTGGMRLYKNGAKVRKDGVSVWGGPATPLKLIYESNGSLVHVDQKSNDYAYGKMEFDTYQTGSCSAGYCLRLVLSIPMQKYLYGLGEVPSSWPQAVLRAQAIAGRTYAMDKINRSGQKRYPCGCAVYDSVLDQAYIGDAKRTGSGQYWDDWKSAVDATDAKIITYQGTPIQALYSSTSGGYTENNENVWGGTPLPYLRGVRDAPDKASPYHEWEFEMDWSQFEAKLDAAYGTGTLEDFKLIKPFGVSGRVTVVQDDGGGGVMVEGSDKTARVSGWSIRSALGLRDTLFRVEVTIGVGERFADKYDRLDGAPGRAVSQPYSVPRSGNQTLGRAQDFAKGRMTANDARDKVVWQWGKVLKKYDAIGREKSKLRMPVTDIWGPGSYLGGSYENGLIAWSPDTGAKVVRGTFRTAYVEAGGVKGSLALPTTGRQKRSSLPEGGRRQRFQGGTLYLNPYLDEVFVILGEVDARFRELGEAMSECGYPISNTAVQEDAAEAEFEHGKITWNRQEGVRVLC